MSTSTLVRLDDYGRENVPDVFTVPIKEIRPIVCNSSNDGVVYVENGRVKLLHVFFGPQFIEGKAYFNSGDENSTQVFARMSANHDYTAIRNEIKSQKSKRSLKA